MPNSWATPQLPSEVSMGVWVHQPWGGKKVHLAGVGCQFWGTAHWGKQAGPSETPSLSSVPGKGESRAGPLVLVSLPNFPPWWHLWASPGDAGGQARPFRIPREGWEARQGSPASGP